MTVTGKGNLKLLSAPKLNLPEGFETYEPKVSENAVSKTFDYLVIPRQEGEYTLPGLDFSYFNLDTKKYVTLPLKLKLRCFLLSGCAQIYSPQTQIKESENDIRYIKKGNFELLKAESDLFNSFKHLALLILPLSFLGAGLVLRRNHIKNNSNQVLVRERKAARLARKQLANAEKLMLQGKKDEFYTEILTALNSYLGNKLNIAVAELSRETIAKFLQQRQVEEKVQQLISTIESGEYVKYAPRC